MPIIISDVLKGPVVEFTSIFFPPAHGSCGPCTCCLAVPMRVYFWHGRTAPSSPQAFRLGRLVPKNFQLEICDFLFGHMHGALNVIK